MQRENKTNFDIVPTGGGAIEMEVSKMLRDESRTIAGKEQLLIGAVAKALEIIPRQLADNAGFDATNILNKLRQKHAQGTNPFNLHISWSKSKESLVLLNY
jgi:T-complex protein 1 subunit eta